MAEVLRYSLVIQGPRDAALDDQVTACLADGWQLQGGVAMTTVNGNLWWAQAIYKSVRVEPEIKEPRMVQKRGKE